MHGLQINKDIVAKATATYTTGTGLTPKASVTLNGATYSPKNELNKIVAQEYLGADTAVDAELRIERYLKPAWRIAE